MLIKIFEGELLQFWNIKVSNEFSTTYDNLTQNINLALTTLLPVHVYSHMIDTPVSVTKTCRSSGNGICLGSYMYMLRYNNTYIVVSKTSAIFVQCVQL